MLLTPAPAQTITMLPGCLLGEDGFEQNCCQVVTPNLPIISSIPSIDGHILLDAQYACIGACTLVEEIPVKVDLQLTSQDCDEMTFDLDFEEDQSGIPGTPPPPFKMSKSTADLPADGYMKYVATWQLQNVHGYTTQVWRYVANINLEWDGQSQNIGCPVPPCAAPPANYDPQFFGMIDIACEGSESGTIWKVALLLSHLEGCYSHFNLPGINHQNLGPMHSGRHDDRSYHLVAPAGFTFINASNIPTSATILPIDGPNYTFVRSNLIGGFRNGAGAVCLGNSAGAGAIGFATRDCNCLAPGQTPPGILLQHFHQNVVGTVTCDLGAGPVMSSFNQNAPSPPSPPNTGFMQSFVGVWNVASGYPETMSMFVNIGNFNYQDLCPGTAVNLSSFHLTHGVTSIHPEEVFLLSNGSLDPGASLVTVQTSFVNSVESDSSMFQIPILGIMPTWGAPHASSLTWHMAR